MSHPHILLAIVLGTRIAYVRPATDRQRQDTRGHSFSPATPPPLSVPLHNNSIVANGGERRRDRYIAVGAGVEGSNEHVFTSNKERHVRLPVLRRGQPPPLSSPGNAKTLPYSWGIKRGHTPAPSRALIDHTPVPPSRRRIYCEYNIYQLLRLKKGTQQQVVVWIK